MIITNVFHDTGACGIGSNVLSPSSALAKRVLREECAGGHHYALLFLSISVLAF